MSRTILNKEISIKDNKAVITENIKTVMDRNQLEVRLRELSMQKAQVQNQNQRLVQQYNDLVEAEREIQDLISQLDAASKIEVIE